MSSRPILSRPRTRIYDANYNIGENYYKPTIDRLDRKYYRPITPPPRLTAVPQDILDRHEKAFMDEDLPSFRRRAEKTITEPTLFDSRGGRISAAALAAEDAFDEEISSAVQRIRASKKVAVIDDIDMESTAGSLLNRRIKDRADKLLDTVGIVEVQPQKKEDEYVVKRRSLRFTKTEDDGVDSKELTKWTPIKSDRGVFEEEMAAKQRASATKARLNEIEEEMNALADKQAARERRAARLKAILAEAQTDSEENASAVQSVRISARKEKRTIEM
ncbi:uncharacterized protein [Onthophagus taurus]|uniref:uncharacterized protein n=1 Tax=Onthophagus taurus TaxID=166361 RepID=UPI000C1FF25B|nr:uncharacterized protein LOC111415868 [Onthophagus taurus]